MAPYHAFPKAMLAQEVTLAVDVKHSETDLDLHQDGVQIDLVGYISGLSEGRIPLSNKYRKLSTKFAMLLLVFNIAALNSNPQWKLRGMASKRSLTQVIISVCRLLHTQTQIPHIVLYIKVPPPRRL
ncbi:hypothetical protein HYE68_000601 [Fusarium pseudograminearum]|nr:hypothetical protein HYE68_000601 [Fusarium pseudograminearum]